MRLVANEGDDHAVKVEEEHDQVVAKLDERLLCVRQYEIPHIIWRMCSAVRTCLWTFNFLKISVASSRCWFSKILVRSAHVYTFQLSNLPIGVCFLLLLRVPGEQRQVQDQSNPVSVDQEQESQDGVYGSLGNDVGVETVAEVNWVDVVTRECVSYVPLVRTPGVGESAGAGEYSSFAATAPNSSKRGFGAYHSRSLYMIVKKTWRKRLTALMSTAMRYSHASPDIMTVVRDRAGQSSIER